MGKIFLFLCISPFVLKANYIKMPTRLEIENAVQRVDVIEQWKKAILQVINSVADSSVRTQNVLLLLLNIKSQLVGVKPQSCSNNNSNLAQYGIKNAIWQRIEPQVINLLLRHASLGQHTAFSYFYSLAHKSPS